MIDTKECLNCGKELINLPQKRSKIFCNTTCRSNYWQKSDRLMKQGKTTEQIVSLLEKERKAVKKQIKENNKPENKARIEAERNPPPEKKPWKPFSNPTLEHRRKLKS